MAPAVVLLVVGLFHRTVAQHTLLPDDQASQALRAAAASVLAAHSPCQHTAVLVTDTQEEGVMLQAPRGLAVLQAAGAGNVRGNTSQTNLRHTAEKIRQAG
ncbi:uncharacterized protein LOC135113554 [Scylla paramamosain]|uniref:uncharacterized protein LOC135113554 n=1 Tax=Scylla paramamosain TaxID=85552 RepID=UPI0030833034